MPFSFSKRHKLIKTAAFFETNAFYGLHPTSTTWPTPTKNILQKYALAQDRNRCCILCFTVFPLYNGPTPDTHRREGGGSYCLINVKICCLMYTYKANQQNYSVFFVQSRKFAVQDNIKVIA